MITIICISILAICLYVLIKTKYSYWRTKGVKGPNPLPFVGNFGQMMMQKQSITQLGEAIYKQFPEEKYVGLYCGFTPVLLVRDPELINQMMTTDFNKFVNRGIRTAEAGFSHNLLISEDNIWRTTRQKLTPTFTGIKLKQMTPLINKCVNKFVQKVETFADAEGNCDVKDLGAKYAMELICSCLFGLNIDFYSDEIKEFAELGKEVITPSAFFRLWYAAEMVIPGIQNMIPAIDPTVHLRAFFIKLVKEIISEREKTKENRHDFLEILIKMLGQNLNNFSNDKNGKKEPKVDVNFIAGQIFVFFTTGFETSSSTLSYLLYELAFHENCQEKVYTEICDVLEKYNGELTFDAVNEMSYLQKVLNETLRKHSFVGWIMRKSGKDYMLPGTNVNVKAGTFVLVSTTGLHSDPKYFNDPEQFNPENFAQDKLRQIPQCAYIPFGVGPRNCIGLRFAKLQIMMAIAAFIRKFKVSPCTDKRKEVKFDSISITLSPVDGIWINVSERH